MEKNQKIKEQAKNFKIKISDITEDEVKDLKRKCAKFPKIHLRFKTRKPEVGKFYWKWFGGFLDHCRMDQSLPILQKSMHLNEGQLKACSELHAKTCAYAFAIEGEYAFTLYYWKYHNPNNQGLDKESMKKAIIKFVHPGLFKYYNKMVSELEEIKKEYKNHVNKKSFFSKLFGRKKTKPSKCEGFSCEL